MKTKTLVAAAIAMLVAWSQPMAGQTQDGVCYIDVTGQADIEIIPDENH